MQITTEVIWQKATPLISCHVWTPIVKEGEVIGGQRWCHSKEVVVCYRLSIVTIFRSLTIRPSTLKSIWGGSLLIKIWVKGLTTVCQILTRSGRDRDVACKRNRVDTCMYVLLYARTWQTNRPWNGIIDRNRRYRLPSMSSKTLGAGYQQDTIQTNDSFRKVRGL